MTYPGPAGLGSVLMFTAGLTRTLKKKKNTKERPGLTTVIEAALTRLFRAIKNPVGNYHWVL